MLLKGFVSLGLSLKQVDAGGDGQIVGVSPTDTIHCLRSDIASSYQQTGDVNWGTIPGSLKYLSCGPSGCWGTNANDDIFFTVNSIFYTTQHCGSLC